METSEIQFGRKADAGRADVSMTPNLRMPGRRTNTKAAWSPSDIQPSNRKEPGRGQLIFDTQSETAPAGTNSEFGGNADRGGQRRPDTHPCPAPANQSGSDAGESVQAGFDTQKKSDTLEPSVTTGTSGGDDSHRAKMCKTPNPAVPGGTNSESGRKAGRAKKARVRETPSNRVPSSPNAIAGDGDAGGQSLADTQLAVAPGTTSSTAMSEAIDLLRVLQKRRRLLIRSINRLGNAQGAYVRSMIGWQSQDPAHYPEGTNIDAIKKANKAVVKRAAKIVKAIVECDLSTLPAEDRGHALNCQGFVIAHCMAQEPLSYALEHTELIDGRKRRVGIEPEMERLAKLMPCYPWVASVYGASAMALAKIVGEAGDLSRYREAGGGMAPAKLWKRMGLAVMDGKRQGNPGAGASSEDWIRHGYAPERRSEMWNNGNGLIGFMGNGPRPMETDTIESIEARSDLSPYQKLFILRLWHEVERDPEHARPGKDGKQSFSKHAAARAKRYVEKRFLRELLRAWFVAAGESNHA